MAFFGGHSLEQNGWAFLTNLLDLVSLQRSAGSSYEARWRSVVALKQRVVESHFDDGREVQVAEQKSELVYSNVEQKVGRDQRKWAFSLQNAGLLCLQNAVGV